MLEGWIWRFRDFLNLSFSYFSYLPPKPAIEIRGRKADQLFQANCESALVNWTSGNSSWIETSKHLGIRITAFKLPNKNLNLITVCIAYLCFCQSHFIYVVNYRESQKNCGWHFPIENQPTFFIPSSFVRARLATEWWRNEKFVIPWSFPKKRPLNENLSIFAFHHRFIRSVII